MSIEPKDLMAEKGGFTQEQAEAICRMIASGTDPEHDPMAFLGELITLGVDAPVAGTLADQIADLRVTAFNGFRGKPGELVALGINAAIAQRFADEINAVNPEQRVGG